MQLSFGGTVMCPSGVDPMICTNQCNNAQCLGYPGPLHCIADPCQMCAVQFYNPKWEPIDACKGKCLTLIKTVKIKVMKFSHA